MNIKTVQALSFGLALEALLFVGCDSGWVGPTEEQGPLPLSSTNAPITRWVKTDKTFEVTLQEVFWDDGNGLVPVKQRVTPVVEAIPKVLMDRLDSTRNIPSTNANGTGDKTIYDAWGVVISVNPDVLIVSVRVRPKGAYAYAFEDWSINPTVSRGDYIHQRLEYFNYIVPDRDIPISAGMLVPWSDEMYVVSTNPKVKFGRLKFENDHATVLLPDGKIVLRHHDDDVDVTRE